MNKKGLLTIIGKEWFEILNKSFVGDVEFQIDGARAQYARTDIKVYPDANDVWRAFVECPLDKLKVIILAQDPYPNGEASGLCFEVKDGYKITPSFNQLADAYNETYPQNFNTNIMDGKLDGWAKQGVLLLNSALTVQAGQPGSHKKYWEGFTKKFIEFIKREHNCSLIIVTIGKPASDLVPESFDSVIRLEHPAYACRQNRKWKYQDFFNTINQNLKIRNKVEIEW